MKDPTLDFAHITSRRTLLLKLDYENLIDRLSKNPDTLTERQKQGVIDIYRAIINNVFILQELEKGIIR